MVTGWMQTEKFKISSVIFNNIIELRFMNYAMDLQDWIVFEVLVIQHFSTNDSALMILTPSPDSSVWILRLFFHYVYAPT